MLALFQVARLTRPQRIRCRATIVRSTQTGTIAGIRQYAQAARRKPAEDGEVTEEDYISHRNDRMEYLMALKLEAERNEAAESSDTAPQKPKRKRLSLPTLLGRRKPVSTSQVAASPKIQMMERAGPATSELSAGPSRIATEARATTRKGKEKAVEQVRATGVEEAQIAEPHFQSALRRNPVGVQMLSPSLHKQLFPGTPLPQPPEDLIKLSRHHLSQHGLSIDGAAILPEVSFNMPPLQGSNLRDHFHKLGSSTAEPYLSFAHELSDANLPPIPENWAKDKAGWTKYHSDGRRESVPDLGEERVVSFDVETLYKLSPYPVMAIAATPDAWYSWLSPAIFTEAPTAADPVLPPWDRRIPAHLPHHLIPLFGSTHSGAERLVIGHNVGYDRARVSDEYTLAGTPTRWLDTLSLHVATRGITSVQRPAWQVYRKNKAAKIAREAETYAVLREQAEAEGDTEWMQELDSQSNQFDIDPESDGGTGAELEAAQKRWEDVTSVNSLAEVASLHCGIPVDKSVRNRFGDDDIIHASQLRPELSSLLDYCANDVFVTHQVYKKVFPLFLASCPHPASFSGVLTMGSSFLPVDESWERYLKNAESKYREMDEGVKRALRVLAEKMRKEGKKEGDFWSEQLDWTEKTARWTEEVGEKVFADMKGEVSTTAEVSVEGEQAVEEAVLMSSIAETAKGRGSEENDRPTFSAEEIKSTRFAQRFLPLLLELSYRSHPVVHLSEHYWCFRVPEAEMDEYIDTHGSPVQLGEKDMHLLKYADDHVFFKIAWEDEGQKRKAKLTGPGVAVLVKEGMLMSERHQLVLERLCKGNASATLEEVERMAQGCDGIWQAQMKNKIDDSSSASTSTSRSSTSLSAQAAQRKAIKAALPTWPKWYWDLTGPTSRLQPGHLDLTIKKSIAPLLLRLQWQGYPLVHSREHKWLFRVAYADPAYELQRRQRGQPVTFAQGLDYLGNDISNSADAAFAADTEHAYFRLPHKDGEGHNVGNPLSKSFVKCIESGELASAAAAQGESDDVARTAAADATNMNVLCSYWSSARERIMGQMVVYDDAKGGSGVNTLEINSDGDASAPPAQRQGMILPQVITMGTVTRRAVEATWLTASNAKKNRVGSELKAMVRAPPEYALVGADVDSEELWISSVMGDSQFGMHGASAIGWMTLEGTKSAGTDLHSKTANILGISRDAAKVFNYSRIYGAGQKHAVQLLLQGDPSLSKEDATRRAAELYKQTKGSRARRSRDLPMASTQELWHGGSESFLFNTLEAIALSDRPTTPALGCGITRALRKSYLDTSNSYLPSRINWVVQSSGVDYLHLLIVSMEYLIRTYGIKARYLLSVHDEVRYLAEENDKYRAALALQIANAWTRGLFALNLGMDDVPQGVAFFSAVDVDKVLRKEVNMSCETPSHPEKIAEGESLGIEELLKMTGGKLGSVVSSIEERREVTANGSSTESPAATETSTIPKGAQLFGDLHSFSHKRFIEVQADKESMRAKWWLDGQRPVSGWEDVPAQMSRPMPRRASRVGRGGKKAAVTKSAG